MLRSHLYWIMHRSDYSLTEYLDKALLRTKWQRHITCFGGDLTAGYFLTAPQYAKLCDAFTSNPEYIIVRVQPGVDRVVSPAALRTGWPRWIGNLDHVTAPSQQSGIEASPLAALEAIGCRCPRGIQRFKCKRLNFYLARSLVPQVEAEIRIVKHNFV